MKKINKPLHKIPREREKQGLNTVQKLLEHSCSTYCNYTAFSINHGESLYELTFEKVFSNVKKFASHLKESGLGKGDHIAILGENCPEWAISYFAVNWIGAVVIPLDYRAGVNDLKPVIKHSDAKALIHSDNLSEIGSFRDSDNKLESFFSFSEIEKCYENYTHGTDKTELSSDDLCQILYTSGTTGNAKGVMLTNGNIMSNVEDMYSFLDINTNDTAFSILPIHHAYENTCGFLTTFYCGVHVFFSRGIKPREMLEDLRIAKPTLWINTPLLLEKLLLRIKRELKSQKGIKKIIIPLLPKKIIGKKIKKHMGLENIRLVVCGGAALAEWISGGLKQFGFPLIQGYGLSETSPLISANPPSKPKNESVGMVIESDEVEIRNPDEEGNGEIWVKGPNVMKGYYKNEQETAAVLQYGWLNTGDVGFLDKDSYLYITGRKKNVIVTSGGKNIFPEEIEEIILRSQFITEALVFSPDDSQLQAIIFPDIDEINFYNKTTFDFSKKEKIWKIIEKEMRKLNRELPAYKKIGKFAVRTEEFPKTTTRKIKRFCFSEIDLRNYDRFL